MNDKTCSEPAELPRVEDDPCINYHRGNPESVEAWQSVPNDVRERCKDKIYMHAVRCVMVGIISDEVEIALGLSHQSCSSKITELKREGKLVMINQKRRTRSGRRARVLVADIYMRNVMEDEKGKPD